MSPSASAPFGGVSFYDGGTLLGTASLVPASSTIPQPSWSTASLGAGQHALTATFNANATWGPSSGAASATLTPAAASQRPSLIGLVVLGGVLKATLLDSSGSALASSQGYVTFLDSGKILGRAPLVNGGASLAFSPAPGLHALAAGFVGPSGLAPSASPVLSQRIGSGADSTLTPATAAIILPAEGRVYIGLQVSAASNQSTALSCVAGIPPGYACHFSPSSVEGSSTSTLTLSPLTTSTLPTQALVGVVATMAGLGWVRRRRLTAPGTCFLWIVAVGMCVTTLLLNGCGRTQNPAPTATSLVVQGVSGAGSESALHQVQIFLRTAP